jgi:predicted lipoprotein with Yx(FWY)xxD motif
MPHRLRTTLCNIPVPLPAKGSSNTMTKSVFASQNLKPRPLLGGALVLGSAALAACGTAYGSAKALGGASRPAAHTTSSAAYTVRTARVGKLGTVLVNGPGRVLYLLSFEAGGKLTCTNANHCTSFWPGTELPAGVTHGIAAGAAHRSLLGTVRMPGGRLQLTYGVEHWPLYTFVGDHAARQAHGEGLHSFGGTWWAISPTGNPVTTRAATPTTTLPPSPTTRPSPPTTEPPPTTTGIP